MALLTKLGHPGATSSISARAFDARRGFSHRVHRGSCRCDRPPDGKLHASSDLTGSLRHAQLRAAGAPERPRTITDEIVLMTGTLWHDLAHKALVAAGLAFMQEVKLDRWMP